MGNGNLELKDKEILTKRVQLAQNSTTEIFSAIGNYDVYEIYAIELHGGGTATHGDIQKKGNSTDYIEKGINIGATGNEVIPKGFVQHKEPAFYLNGGEGLQGIEVDDNTAVDCTIYYKELIS